tara:strand:- start:237952 stop:241986 length:4035 start_codon:yes stop_codon:yes gene_type:complete
MSAKRSSLVNKLRNKAGRSAKLARNDRRNQRRKIGGALENLESRLLLAFSADVFADINQFGVSSNIDSMVEFDGRAFFAADDGQTGSELWASDGTPGGTARFADLLPGTDGSQPSNLTVVGSHLFFTAADQSGEFDLWKTDGTESGTELVYDANEAGVYGLERLTASGGKLFFTAYQIDTDPGPGDNATGQELWVSDGSSAGTMMVADLNPDQAAYGAEGPQELTDHNGTLFFTSYDASFNRDIWSSDGTAGNTIKVADLNDLNTSELTSVGTNLFFAAEDAGTGLELYVYDGASTTLLEINPGFAGSNPTDIVEFDGEAYFSADNGSATRLLFHSDGTSVSLAGDGSNVVTDPADLTVVGSRLFFAAAGGNVVSDNSPSINANNTLYAPTGTPDGLAGIVDSITAPNQGGLTVGGSSGNAFTANPMNAVNDGPGWVSGGAIGDPGVGLTTMAVGDLYLEDVSGSDLASYQWDWNVSALPGESLSSIEFHGFASGNQFDNGTAGQEDEGLNFTLILNTGTATQIEVQGDDLDNWFAGRDANNINLVHPGGAAVTSATVRMTFNGLQLNGGEEAVLVNAELTAISGEVGRELWRTNGSTNVLVEDIVAGGSSNPSQLTEAGGRLYFSADEPTGVGRELWRSQGAFDAPGTARLIDSFTGNGEDGSPNDGTPEDLVEVNNQLFFTTLDNSGDRELWTSQGTTASTDPVLNINPSTKSADVEQVVVNGTDIFFVANDGINGDAVWVADTLNPGSVTMIDMTPGTSAETISGLSIQDGSVWFWNNLAGTNADGAIYRTDGTTTLLVGEQSPIPLSSDPNDLFTTFNGRVYFSARDNQGVELWRSNGAGTSIARFVDIYTGTNNNGGANSSDPEYLTVFDGKLYFAATEITPAAGFDGFGRELWESDGTVGGTVQTQDIYVDDVAGNGTVRSSNPGDLIVSGSNLFFTANNGLAGGVELFVLPTGGSPTLIEIDPGNGGSTPINLTDVNGVLYFGADAGNDEDDEPYKSDGINTTLIQNINTTGNQGSKPSGFVELGGQVYFAATSTNNGRELWRTTTTAAELVSDVAGSASPTELAVANGRVFYSAVDENESDRELWTSGGPLATGSAQVLDLFPGVFRGGQPADIVEVGGTIYFVGEDENSGRELFVLNEVTPQVESVVINDGSAQRSQITSVTVTFDSVVDATAAAFELTNIDTSTTVTNVQVELSEQDFKTVAVLTFADGGASVVDRLGATGTDLGNSLANGNYRLDVIGSLLTDPAGGGTIADYQFGGQTSGEANNDDFFRHYGDVTGDGSTDFTDFSNGFLPSFAQSEGSDAFEPSLDVDGDGSVNFTDFSNGFLPAFATSRQ